jgi:murein DD-endopeptidase MepM/ murein hydrolase activator NlpD
LIKAINLFHIAALSVSLAALLISAAAYAEIRTGLSADELFPGDAFSINIAGASSSADVSATFNELQIPLTKCGPERLCGIGVIPPKTVPGKASIIVKSATDVSKTAITVRSPDYPVRHIKLPSKKVDLSQDDIVRVRNEAERLKAIWLTRNNRLFEEEFVMPLPNPVTTGYGVKRIFNKKKTSVHQGVDIKGDLGEEVRASNRGMALMADDLFFGGNTIIIDHGVGIFTIYMHLDSFRVKPGAMVERGQTIGLVGSTGRASGPHLHFGLKILDISANPVSIMAISVR